MLLKIRDAIFSSLHSLFSLLECIALLVGMIVLTQMLSVFFSVSVQTIIGIGLILLAIYIALIIRELKWDDHFIAKCLFIVFGWLGPASMIWIGICLVINGC